jgi:hypothetical protein
MKAIFLEDELHEYALFMIHNYMKQADMEEIIPLKDLYVAFRDAPDPLAMMQKQSSLVGEPFDDNGTKVIPIQGPLSVEVTPEQLSELLTPE